MTLMFENENGNKIKFSQAMRSARLLEWNFGATGETTNTFDIPFHHGEIYESCKMEARECTFKVYIREESKKEAVGALNPLSCAVMTVNGRYKAYGKVIGAPVFSQYRSGTATFTFRMFEPFFKTEMQTYEFSGAASFINGGDASSPARITLYGAAENPYMEYVTGGKTIAFDYDLSENEKIEIDTGVLTNDIKIISQEESKSAFAYKKEGSTIFDIANGINKFLSNCRVKIEYEPRFWEVSL